MINNLKNFGTVDPELKIILGPCIESLSISGDWTNTQYAGSPVDYTGLTFTVTYNNGTTASVTPTSYSPSTWSSTVGTQTCTFTYEENKFEVSGSKSASVTQNPLSIPLTLQAREAGNISIKKQGNPGTIYYSKNGGAQTELASDVNVPVIAGDKVSLYRTLSGNLSTSNYFSINCTGNCYVYGNVMSLYNKDNFATADTISYSYVFYRLFYNNTHIDIDESVGKFVLPATTLAVGCYSYMFSDCTGLTSIPAGLLPATTLAVYCYHYMFSGCTGLTSIPAGLLPATTLANYCYYYMFFGCTGLTSIPAGLLPATTLAKAKGCYGFMFFDCTGLTSIPAGLLPATTLADNCYEAMFYNCEGLTTAPILPATTLAKSCYSYMFFGCTGLTSITCLATNISASGCTMNWVSGVSATGTFYKSPSMSSWTTGTSGIPSGWTVVSNGKVGGTIFYIDSTASGTYRFFNAQGQEVSAPTVGTDCTGWSYEAIGANKDKFYVYNSSAMFKGDRTGTQTYPYVAWTYLDTTNQSYIDNAEYTSGLPSGRTEWSYYGHYGRVFETLDGTYTGTAIGTGKSNTSNMLSLRNGAYNQSSQEAWRGQTTYSETIWYVCDQFNKGTYSLNGSPVPNNTGCDDWYIPSKDELETIKNAIGASTFASMLYSGDISSARISPWSSSADSYVASSWRWFWRRGGDLGMSNGNRYSGNNNYCLALSRSF